MYYFLEVLQVALFVTDRVCITCIDIVKQDEILFI